MSRPIFSLRPLFLTVLFILLIWGSGALIESAVAKPCDRECGSIRYMKRITAPYNAKLNRMAWCESTGRWYINTGNGYYGGLQFDRQTWRSVGGHGYPHKHSKLEQKYRAVKLIKRRGYQPWPKCGYA